MTDIIERLRTDVLWHRRRGNETIAEDCDEAADELERLRGIVPDVLERLNDEMCSENEQLRAKVAALEDDAARWQIARKLSPQTWANAWGLNLSTGKPFDQIIDDLAPFYGVKDKP